MVHMSTGQSRMVVENSVVMFFNRDNRGFGDYLVFLAVCLQSTKSADSFLKHSICECTECDPLEGWPALHGVNNIHFIWTVVTIRPWLHSRCCSPSVLSHRSLCAYCLYGHRENYALTERKYTQLCVIQAHVASSCDVLVQCHTTVLSG